MANDNTLLGTQFIRFAADTAGYASSVNGAEAHAGAAGRSIEVTFNRVQDHIKETVATARNATQVVEGLVEQVAKFVMPATIAVSLLAIGKSTLESADHIEHLSQQLGISTEKLSQWEYAGKTVGVELGTMARAVGLLARQMVKGTDETGQTSKGLEHLGLSSKNAAGGLKSTDEMLGEIAERFKTMPDGPLKTASAMELFGRGGKEMIPLLNLGKKGLDDLKQSAEDAGYVLSEKTAKQAHALSVEIEEMKLRGEGLARTVMSSTLPALLAFAASLHNISISAKGAKDATKDFDDETKTLAGWASNTNGFTKLVQGWLLVETGALQAAAATTFAGRAIAEIFKERHDAKSLADPWGAISAGIAKQENQYSRDLAAIGDRLAANWAKANGESPLGSGAEVNTEGIAQHTEAIDKLNRSLQMNILQQKLKDAEDAGNIELQEKLSAAIRQVTNYDDLQAGADKNLVAINESLAAKIEHRTLMTAAATEAAKRHAEAEKENAKALALRLKLQSDAEGAEKNLSTAIDGYYTRRRTTEQAFESFMLASQKRMTLASLSGKAQEVAAVMDAADQRKATIQNELDDDKILWDQAKEMILQSESETAAELLRIDQKYADDYATVLQRLVTEYGSAKNLMINSAEQAANQMTATMSDIFFDGITGKVNELQKVFRNFLGQLLRDITDFLAKQATKQLLGMALNAALRYRSGGGGVLGQAADDDFSNFSAGSSISLPPVSTSRITVPTTSTISATRGPVVSALSVPRYAMPAPSNGKSQAEHVRVDVTLDQGLVGNIVRASSQAGYASVADDIRNGGPLYHSMVYIAKRA